MDEVSSNQHSSAYSSLANSTTEIHDIVKMEGESSGKVRNNKRATVDLQMRAISEDYNALLRRATEQIRVLTAEKHELDEQCKKHITLNEEIAGELAAAVERESELRSENEAVIAANEELFAEAQRLSDEEEKWESEREGFQEEIGALKARVETLDEKVGSEVREASERLAAEGRLRLEDSERERAALEAANREMEERVGRMAAAVGRIESEKDSLLRRKEGVAGENMQLMVEANEQAKQFKQKTAALQAQLQKAEDRCKKADKENARLRSQSAATPAPVVVAAPPVMMASPGALADKRYGDLVERNKNLTEWREQLIGKNKSLAEENDKLKAKCQSLEDLLHDEETDINDVLELIKNMQQQPGSPNGSAGGGIGPISKFREFTREDLQKLRRKN